jgi:D-alanyl-D-alanine carboxypeptidase (penicillin-binding protein 5/6)
MGGSQILLETVEQMSVQDLFKGVAVASGNDAAVALAEKIGGTQDNFVNMMNERAKKLGLTDTNFKNCHGLDDANHYSSAYDMSVMARELLKHEKVLEFTSIYEDYLRKDTDRAFWLVNTNKLVRSYKGVDGLKTGYTESAGFCMTATANIDGMRVITVVMGEKDSKTRNSEVATIFDYVYAQYALNKVVNTNTVVDTVKIERANIDSVDIIPTEDVNSLYKKADGVGNINYEIDVDNLKAPISKGEVVGKLILKQDDKTIKTIDLTVKEDVKKANFFQLYYRYFKKIITMNN